MFQRIEIIGNLGRDPELRYTPAGQAICNMSVATSHVYKNSAGEKVTETTWFRVSVWGAAAESASKYLTKGSKVFVAGRMVSDKATGGPKLFKKQDGTEAANFEINASEIKFLSSKNGDTSPAQETSVVDDDTIPF